MPSGSPEFPEKWTVGYLLEVILTRDTWMHCVGLCRATGGEPALTADHDGRLVADVVVEWARRHGRPFTLSLTGPAGGSFTSGGGGEPIEIDAVEFCRVLSGRGTGTGVCRSGSASRAEGVTPGMRRGRSENLSASTVTRGAQCSYR